MYDEADQQAYDRFVGRLPQSVVQSLRDGTAEPEVEELLREHVISVVAQQVEMATDDVTRCTDLLAETDKCIADFAHVRTGELTAQMAEMSQRCRKRLQDARGSICQPHPEEKNVTSCSGAFQIKFSRSAKIDKKKRAHMHSCV